MRNILFPILLFLLFQSQGTVKGEIIATIIGGASEVCLGDSVAVFLSFTGGVAPWNAVINDKDGEFLVLEAVPASFTLWIKPEENNTYSISYIEDSEGTAGTPLGEAGITVNQSTPVAFQMDRTVFLPSESGIPLASSPPGGLFTGPGVTGSAFYPGIATAAGSPHQITCTYSNEFGCVSTDEIEFTVLSGIADVVLVSDGDTINTICNDGGTYFLRGSNADGIPGIFELVETATQDTLSGHITDTALFDNEAILDPVGLSGSYDLVYSYGVDVAMVRTTYRILVNDLGSVGILNLPDTICLNASPIRLLPESAGDDPGATFVFTGTGVSGNQADGYYYDSSLPGVVVGRNEISMEYTSSNGCKAVTIQGIYNLFAPRVDFTPGELCLPADGGNVLFTNLTGEKDSVVSWSWVFGDPGSGSGNMSSLENPEHFYGEPGPVEIILTAITSNGCSASHSMDTVLADRPVADFVLLGNCLVADQPTLFMVRSVSDFSVIDTLVWTFKNSNGEVLDVVGSNDPSDTIKILLNSTDRYLIGLKVINVLGCSGEVEQEISLQSTLSLADGTYDEDFNGDGEFWLIRSADQLGSWVLDVPDFDGFDQVPGDLAWFTRLPVQGNGYLERSWIQSPCFDFTGVTNPVVQLDLMRSFVPGIDGAVLQYMDVPGEGWKTIGNVEEGLNWYNQWGIYNEPGGSNFGWGLQSPFEPDKQWLKASYPLDMLVGKRNVIFRIAIATGGSMEVEPGKFNQGFAFDNFFLGERHRYSLLEYFTNAASEEARIADERIDTFSSRYADHVICLQYHVDYPGEDAMNQNNPFPPSTRSFSYGVQKVPYAVLNGGVSPGTRFDFIDPPQGPDEEGLRKESLEIPLFDVDLQVDYLENSLDAQIKVTCTADTFISSVQLYLVVIEREVTAYKGLNQDTLFRNVVLDMLPSPAGKLLGGEWSRGETETLTYSWEYAETLEDIEDLSVVAFVQDRDNRQVMQAEAKPHTPGVGIRHGEKLPGPLAVFPNPALNDLYVRLGTPSVKQGELVLVDLSGRVVLQQPMEPELRFYHLDISQLSRGIYMICWLESGEVKGRTKFICIR